MTKTVLSFIGGFIIGLFILFAWNSYTDRPVQDVAPESTVPDSLSTDADAISKTTNTDDTVLNNEIRETPETAKIQVSEQAAGHSVTVNSAILDVNGWIVVHEEKDGFVSNALGASRADQGVHTNITVPLLRGTEPGNRYWIVLYSDNGDREFSLTDDFPLKDTAGAPLISSFQTI